MYGYFRYVRVKIVPWNLPPALIHVASQTELMTSRPAETAFCRND
jgi:hypothetical protein